MKKIYCFILFYSALSSLAMGQSMVNDALSIARLLRTSGCVPSTLETDNPENRTSDFTNALILLGKYLPAEERSGNMQEIYNLYSQNPFFSAGFQVCDWFKGSTLPPPTFSALSREIRASYPSMPITTAVDGASQFLVERTKKEISLAFLSDFQRTMTTSPALSVLFPQSTVTLSAIEKDIYRFSGYIQTLHQSFRKDLEVLPLNLSKLLENDIIELEPSKKLLLIDLLMATQLLAENNNLPAIVDFLGDLSANAPLSENEDIQNIRAGLQAAKLLSNALITTASEQTYVSASTFTTLSLDPVALRVFFGILWQQAGENIKFGNGSNLRDRLEGLAATGSVFDFYVQMLRQILVNAAQLDGLIEARAINMIFAESELNPDNPTFHQYVNYIAAIIEGLVGFTNKELYQDEVQQHFAALTAAMNLPVDVKRANYSAAIVNLQTILSYASENTTNEELLQYIITYGSFIASVATAKTSSEAAAAIEAFALPVGSSAIKRNAKTNIALNAYVGLEAGVETIIEEGALENENAFFTSITAPLGISLSTSTQRNASLTAFLSFIDLGAITAFRFNDTSTADLPVITLDNIIAPGGYFIYGFRNTPISFGIGGQWGPNLRAVTSTDLMLDEVRTFRYGAFLAVDIPLINFKNRTK